MWPLEHPQGIKFDLVTYFMIPGDLNLNLSSRQIFRRIFKQIVQEMWPLQRPKGISLI